MRAENHPMPQANSKPRRRLRGLAPATGYFLWLGVLMAVVSLVMAIDAGLYDAFKNYHPGVSVLPADPWHAHGQPKLLVYLAAIGLVNSVLLLVASNALHKQEPVAARNMVTASSLFGLIGIIWTLIQLFINLGRIH